MNARDLSVALSGVPGLSKVQDSAGNEIGSLEVKDGAITLIAEPAPSRSKKVKSEEKAPE